MYISIIYIKGCHLPPKKENRMTCLLIFVLFLYLIPIPHCIQIQIQIKHDLIVTKDGSEYGPYESIMALKDREGVVLII